MHFGQATEHQKQSGLPVEYDRKIKYLDYMENGERSRGAGFIKLERRGNRCNISLQVNGLYRKDHFTRPLLLMADGEERELCKLQMANGGIKTYLEGLDCSSMDGQGLAYESLTGLRIPISEGKEVLCLWGTQAGAHVETQANRAESVTVRSEPPQSEPKRDESVQNGPTPYESMRSEPVQNPPTWNENMQNEMPWNASMHNEPSQNQSAWNESERNQSMQSESPRSQSARDESLRDRSMRDEMHIRHTRDEYAQAKTEAPMPEIQILDIQKPESRKQSASRKQDATVPFKEDKWEQLWAIYPHIHPFSDEREYLSFGLSDLVVLPARYYRLVNNSFLLHGFYNFHHLILTRLNGRNGARYFIGVPGNLYQTEKDTAIMFGFENFECDREPAGKGDFGYYLIPVEL